MKEFYENFKLFDVYALVKNNAALCKDLFVPNTSHPVKHQNEILRSHSWKIVEIIAQAPALKAKNVTDENGVLEADKFQAVSALSQTTWLVNRTVTSPCKWRTPDNSGTI